MKTALVSGSTKDHASRTNTRKSSYDAVEIRDIKDKATYKSHQMEMTGCRQEVNYTDSYFLNSNNRTQEIVNSPKGKIKDQSLKPTTILRVFLFTSNINLLGMMVYAWNPKTLKTKDREPFELRNSRAAWATWLSSNIHTGLDKERLGDFSSQHLYQAIHNCL